MMTQEQRKEYMKNYKEFFGKYNEQMPNLIGEGFKPMSVYDIIEKRLDGDKYFEDNYFDTCDAIVYGKKGKFKIIKNCLALLNITPKTKLERGAIKISKVEYENYTAREFNKESTKEEIWKYFLEDLYERYIKKLGYCPEVYRSQEEFRILAFCVFGLDGGSRLGGGVHLDVDDCRLVGYLASETQAQSMIPHCLICNVPMKNSIDSKTKKISKYLWETNCEHLRGMRLSIG